MEILFELIVVILGLWCIIFYKLIATKTVWFHSKFLGLRANEKSLRVGYLMCGIIFIMFGLLSIFKVI